MSPASTTRPLSRATRLAIWAGIVGPILFIAVFTVDGFLTPGYSAVNDAVSYLSLGSHGWIQAANFIATGLLLGIFALGFARRMGPVIARGWLYAGATLLLLSGLGYVTAGVFTSAPPGQPQHPLHTIAFSVVFFSAAMACLITGWQLIKTQAWRGFGWYSIITGLLTITPPLGNLSSLFAPTPATPVSSPAPDLPFFGIVNRLVIVVASAWCVALASRMLASSGADGRAPQDSED